MAAAAAAAASTTSLVNSALSLSRSNPLPPITPPPHLIPLPLTSFSASLSLKSTLPLLPVLPEDEDSLVSALWPCISYSNTLFFKSGYNVQVTVDEDEPEEQLIGRFRREVLRAGVIQETKRRRFFETTQDKRKRKSREAAKRNRKRRFPPKGLEEDDKTESPKGEDNGDEDDDNWELIETELPYCHSK